MKRVAVACVVGLLVGCDGKGSDGAAKAATDSVMVEAVRDSVRVDSPPGSSLLQGPSTDGEPFLESLEEAMVPVRDSLAREVVRIRRLTDGSARDSAILELNGRWGRVQESQLQSLLDQSAFTSRMWIDSLKSSDTAFKRRVRQILGSGGKYLEYDEGFSAEVDLGARADLFDSVASPALAERLRLEHRESFTGVYNDAGIIVPLDTLVGRIQGWESFARRFPGTRSAAWADTVRKGYLYSLVCGATNTRAFTKDKPDSEFLEAWNHLAAGQDGPSRAWIRQWLSVLKSEKGRLTPKAKAWLADQGYAPEVFEDDGI